MPIFMDLEIGVVFKKKYEQSYNNAKDVKRKNIQLIVFKKPQFRANQIIFVPNLTTQNIDKRCNI